MSRYFVLLALFVGCASFKPIDLRPDDPPELGDVYGFGATSVQYRVLEIDPDYSATTSQLTCVNTMEDARAQCKEGDICLSMRRIDPSADQMQETLCMRQQYVTEIYHVDQRANGFYN